MKQLILVFVSSIFLITGCNAQKEKDALINPESTSIQALQARFPQVQQYLDRASDQTTFNFRLAVKKSTPAVVHIKSTQKIIGQPQMPDFFRDFFPDGFGFHNYPDDSPQLAQGSASGVILTSNGYIATNNHVVDGAESIQIVLHDQRIYDAKIIGKDPATDLALLKIDETDLAFIEYGNSDSIEVGDLVLAVGNPFNLASTVTAGIVSAKARNINILTDRFAVESYIQTDAAVNRGNSGGALVDVNGKLVGINSAISTPTGVYAGYSFAIPTEIVKKVIDDLLKYGKVMRGYLGVVIRDANAKAGKQIGKGVIPGIIVDSVEMNGAASRAGIKVQDVIIKVDRQDVATSNQLRELITRHRPGDKVQLTIVRNGKELVIPVVLMPIKEITRDRNLEITVLKRLGVELENIGDAEKAKLNIDGGVIISHIYQGIISRQTTIREGFVITAVNKQKVVSVDDFLAKMSSSKGGVLLEGQYLTRPGVYYYAFGF